MIDIDIRLYPRPVPTIGAHQTAGDCLQIWIGVFGVATRPPIQWFLDGAPVTPTTVVALDSVRSAELVPSAPPRAFTGVYEFTGLQPERSYTVTAQSGGQQGSIEVRTLPNQLSADSNTPFHVLLVSCYYQPEDRNELVNAVISQLKGTLRPQLTLLLGDQVYLDLPTLTDYKDDTAWLAEWFEGYYVRNWQGPGGLRAILSSAPCISIPDDHEYWNNAPHSSPVVGNTKSPEGRQRWKTTAEMLYRGFQLPSPLQLGDSFILDIPPLSFFLADSRSQRSESRGQSMTPQARQALHEWCDRVSEEGLFGIFATGQSLYDEPVGSLKGRVADYSLSNYGDYSEIVRILMSIPDRGQPILCLTGDVHWGRVTKSIDVKTGRDVVYEVISSPSALVSSVGVDQLKKVGGFFGGLVGKSDPWPRHSDPDKPPDFFAMQVLDKRYRSGELRGQPGDQVVLLSFTRAGHGVDVLVTYYPIHEDVQVRRPIALGPLHLRPLL